MIRRNRKNIIKAIVLSLVLFGCEISGILPNPNALVIYAASGGQTASSDILNVKLTSDGWTVATMGGLSESAYIATDNTAGQQTGTIKLDNISVGGYMHVNIGQTIEMYAPATDVDYTDKIGFSGNYTFRAAGGKGGNIAARDIWAGTAYSTGGYGSVVTNSMIDYNTGQSITYRKGSNGRSITTSEATNTTYWNHGTSTGVLSTFMGNINGGLAGDTPNSKAWSVVAQVGTASYIQVSGNEYIVAGGGAPGVVLFSCYNGSYSVAGANGMHADITPPFLNGADGFDNPSSTAMARRYRDYNGMFNINANRIAGTAKKTGVAVSSYWGGGVRYEDMFYGWTRGADGESKGISLVYPGYSGLASRSGSLFNPYGLNNSSYSVTVNTSATQSNPYLQLSCNAKYITITNPTREGYTFAGWTCEPGVSVVGKSGNSYRFKVTDSGATITANWNPIQYTIVFDSNGGAGEMTSIMTQYDADIILPDGASLFTKYTKNGANVTGKVPEEKLMPTGEGEADADTGIYQSVFLGWAFAEGKDEFTPQWKAGETVRNLTIDDGAVVTLYAVWDDCPWIEATHLYYTLEQAKNGYITQDEILSHATAYDREDGSPILPGVHDNGTSFTIPDYALTDFTQFRQEGSCTENLTVADSSGSIYAKQITVYIVDTTPVMVEPDGITRFIDEYYYNQPYEYGGLKDDSAWKTEPEYIAAIQKAFDNLKNDTPEEIYYFTHEQIMEMKKFVSENVSGNTRREEVLMCFYDKFMAPNRAK